MKKIMQKILDKYDNDMIIIFYDGDSKCYLSTKIVFLSNRIKKDPNDDNIFEMLHEIGHIMNNDIDMKICEGEYYATIWAIKESKKYNLNISNNCKKMYQDYINKYAKYRKTISVSDVVLKW